MGEEVGGWGWFEESRLVVFPHVCLSVCDLVLFVTLPLHPGYIQEGNKDSSLLHFIQMVVLMNKKLNFGINLKSITFILLLNE
jgi:hypothetical protein